MQAIAWLSDMLQIKSLLITSLLGESENSNNKLHSVDDATDNTTFPFIS